MNYMAVKKTLKAVPEVQEVETKSFLYSKQIWFNVIMTIVGIGAYFQVTAPAEFVPYAIGVQTIGNIILRVWFNEQPLAFTFTSKKK